MQNKNIILASGSPRRKEILEKAAFEFLVRPSDADENIVQKEDNGKKRAIIRLFCEICAQCKNVEN